MKNLLSLALAACLAIAVSAQTAPSGGLFGTPTNFSGSFLIQRKSSLACLEIPVKVWASKNTRLTYQFEGLGAYNATQSNSAIGTAITARYQVNSIFSFTVGVGATVPLQSFRLSDVNGNTVGLLVGGSFKF